MKAIKYFLYALIATFVFAGCSDDPTYTRGESEADGCYGVYFPSQDNAADLELDPADPTVLTFTAMRTNDADAITVPVTVTAKARWRSTNATTTPATTASATSTRRSIWLRC